MRFTVHAGHNPEFTFQYGSTLIKLIQKDNSKKPTFTFQYGSTLIYRFKDINNNVIYIFTFQYGSTLMPCLN